MNKPIIKECFADNGEHSHWELINSDTGEVLWSEEYNPMTELKEFEKVLPIGGKNLALTRLTAEKEVFVEGMKFINGVPFPYRFQGRSIWGGNGWELTECKEAVDNGQ
jgi:hypothetical protein